MRTPIALAAAALAAGMAAPERAAAQVPAGGEFQANTYTTAAQAAVAIAEAPDGRFVVVWNSLDYASSGDVIARRYDAAGAAQGAAFRVNTYTTAFQAQPAVAMDRRGNFAVVWASYGQTGSGHEVFGQLFDSAGARIGGEFQVNTGTTGTQYLPAVAMAPGGAFVVAWEDYSQAPPNLRYVVSARRFDAGANALGAEFVANTYTAAGSFQFYPSVGVDDSGAFVVAWESDALSGTPQDGSGGGVFGQRFGAAGNRIGAEFRVNAYTTGRQGRPAVAVAPDGRFLVAWDSAQDGGSTGILAQRFDASGMPAGGELLVNTYTTGLQADASVRADARGNFVVAWESATQDGDALGVFGQRLDANGARRGNEFRANGTPTGSQDNAAVGVDSVGNFTLAWESPQDGSSDAAMARRFGGLFPRPMAVDPAGNGVMEPGETAVVRPSWQNLNGAPQAFGSTLSAFTGPAGATYTINDGSASYGSVPDGATQACVDCFAVTAAAATRPVQHWDASAQETINPVSQGQQKQWTLHVGASFADVGPTNPFYRFVETLLHHAVTGGCTATDYCPANATTREQMAVLVLVAREGAGYAPPPCTTPPFNDVPVGSGFCRFVAELARRGVVSGCGGGNFCPTADVTRAQMAVFVLRTLDPQLIPPGCVAGTELFNDVPASSGFCPWVEELARRGVVSGCGGGGYCPDDPVTRGQMGVFLSVTFGLALYGA